MKTKEFHLGDVLSVITNRNLSPRELYGLSDILEFMTGYSLFDSRLVPVYGVCRLCLIQQFPELTTPEMDIAISELDEMVEKKNERYKSTEISNIISSWLHKVISGGYNGIKCNETLTVRPFPEGIDPLRVN